MEVHFFLLFFFDFLRKIIYSKETFISKKVWSTLKRICQYILIDSLSIYLFFIYLFGRLSNGFPVLYEQFFFILLTISFHYPLRAQYTDDVVNSAMRAKRVLLLLLLLLYNSYEYEFVCR